MSDLPYDQDVYDEAVLAEEAQQTQESFDDRVLRLAAELARLGVTRRQVERLFSQYEIDVIEQQLIWLPYRRARNQASVIVMAICENYEKPARMAILVADLSKRLNRA